MNKRLITQIGLILLLSVIILGTLQIVNTSPALANTKWCCNNEGWRLCDPEDPSWYDYWKCWDAVQEIECEIDAMDCWEVWRCNQTPPTFMGCSCP